MPPKCLFTRQEVIAAALRITRRAGAPALTARALAGELGCSAKPIFGLFKNMEEVQQAVLAAAQQLYEGYLAQDMAAGKYPPYKASGMAYIRFATQEKQLFRLLFMRDRGGETTAPTQPDIRPLLALIQQALGVDEETARLFHLEMWVVVHGIAAMVATSYLAWDEPLISRVLTDTYLGLKSRFMGGA